ncbi:hypothetical protein ABL78_4780 [Leptomonas seymouri]|uniref:Uncharacterized protein n=1 Tax=Leptomonas seymouri TaxID=5684 RepID=A0A0N1I5W2_LEPSE|nr:hypothetical protein ABL78_4780 [Leptomonas seymouri]|eukprot:KPI86158.1 hypothetical protein ABL78_4780 [Leptomonas seymouri]
MSKPPSPSTGGSVAPPTSTTTLSTTEGAPRQADVLPTGSTAVGTLPVSTVIDEIRGPEELSRCSDVPTLSPVVPDAVITSRPALARVSGGSSSGSISEEADICSPLHSSELQQEKGMEATDSRAEDAEAPRAVPQARNKSEVSSASSNLGFLKTSEEVGATASVLQPHLKPSEATSPTSIADSQSPADSPPSNAQEELGSIEQQSASEGSSSVPYDATSKAPLAKVAETRIAEDDVRDAHNGVDTEKTCSSRRDAEAISEENPEVPGGVAAPTHIGSSGTVAQIPVGHNTEENTITDAHTSTGDEEAKAPDKGNDSGSGQINLASVVVREEGGLEDDRMTVASPDVLASEPEEEKQIVHLEKTGMTNATEKPHTADVGHTVGSRESTLLGCGHPTDVAASPTDSQSTHDDAHKGASSVLEIEADQAPPQFSLPAKTRKRRRAPLVGPARTQLRHTAPNQGSCEQVVLDKESVLAAHRGDALQTPSMPKPICGAVNAEAEVENSLLLVSVPSTVQKAELHLVAAAEVEEDNGEDGEGEQVTDTHADAALKVADSIKVLAGGDDQPSPRRAKTEFCPDVETDATTPASLSSPLATTIAERAAVAVPSDADDVRPRPKLGTRKRTLSASEANASELLMKGTHNGAKAQGRTHAALACAPPSPPAPPTTSTALHSPPVPSCPSVVSSIVASTSSTKPVLNIAGVNVQALLAESSDPPPVYFRRQRRTRRKSVLAEDHPIFAEHRDLCQHDHAHRIITRAPFASDVDVLNSLVEWKDSPSLVYARLLWQYTPKPFLHAAMYGLDASAQLKAEPKPRDVNDCNVKKENDEN